jgi:hypothetical protein
VARFRRGDRSYASFIHHCVGGDADDASKSAAAPVHPDILMADHALRDLADEQRDKSDRDKSVALNGRENAIPLLAQMACQFRLARG